MPFVYVLKSMKNGRYYVGSTNDLTRRMAEHKRGKTKYTRNSGPYKLIYKRSFRTLKEARQKEYQIKKMKNREYIEKFIEGA